jgi:hypothetical protein
MATSTRNLLNIPDAVLPGPTSATVWVKMVTGTDLQLTRRDGAPLSRDDQRAHDRALALGEMMRQGAQPYYDAGAYCRGLILSIPRPEPVFVKYGSHVHVSTHITVKVPFWYKDTPELSYDLHEAPSTPWRPVKGYRPGTWHLERTTKGGRIEQSRTRPGLSAPANVYQSERTAQRRADKLNQEG